MPSKKPKAVRRWVSDPRSDSQLRWLRNIASLTLETGRPPSDSTLMRRALARYVDHWYDLLQAGRLDGFPGPHPQDAHAERKLLDQYTLVTASAQPAALVDNRGRIQTWEEAIGAAIQSRLGLTIPTADSKEGE